MIKGGRCRWITRELKRLLWGIVFLFTSRSVDSWKGEAEPLHTLCCAGQERERAENTRKCVERMELHLPVQDSATLE